MERYLCAENGGGTIIVINRMAASGWETFKVKVLISAEFCNVLIRIFIMVFLRLCIVMEDQRDDIQLQGLQQPVCGTQWGWFSSHF